MDVCLLMTETCRVTLGRKRDVADKLMILKWKIILDFLGGSFWGAVLGFCRWLSGKESTCQCRRRRRLKFDPWVGKILWRRKWQPTPVFLLGEFHGQRSLASYSLCGCKESDMTEWLTRTHTFTCVRAHTHTHRHRELRGIPDGSVSIDLIFSIVFLVSIIFTSALIF